MKKSELQKLVADIQELKKIYNKTYELDQLVASTAFENSPIVEHTNAIMQYCIAQKKRIFQSKGLGE